MMSKMAVLILTSSVFLLLLLLLVVVVVVVMAAFSQSIGTLLLLSPPLSLSLSLDRKNDCR